MTATQPPESLPQTVWASRGWFVGPGTIALVADRMAALRAENVVEDWTRADRTYSAQSAVFDARWSVASSVGVRARLTLSDHPEHGGALWQLTARATEPWDWAWPSPLTLFGPPGTMWDICDQSHAARFGEPNRVPTTTSLRMWLNEAARSPWSISVLRHDDSTALIPGTSLLEALPPGLMGRVLEFRVTSDQRQAVNRVLKGSGAKLPPGGAVILASHPPHPLPSDLEVRGDLAADHTPLVEAVLRYTAMPWPATPATLALAHELHDTWTLETDQERAERTQNTLVEKDRLISALTADRDTWQNLAAAQATKLQHALHTADHAEAREQTALGRVRDAEQRFADLAAASRAGALTAAAEAAEERREQAELDLEAAEELLDAQNEEIIRWRAWSAAIGQSATTPPPQATAPVPDTWEELLRRTRRELARIALTDITETTRPLRGHPLEQVWIRRTWHTLKTLHAYAEAKTRHGPELLPHLAAYLRWPAAGDLIPTTRHAPAESQSTMTSTRLRETRRFPVPRTIDPSGRTFMGEHIRIGSGRPPAPRLHFHDDTHGRTQQIHIGYIGPHLP
ncbi:hypothetical protein SAVIM338S_06285 [Streptomyces avidinii]